MGFRHGPWETRTVDVPGLDPSGDSGVFVVSSTIQRGDVAASYGATSPGTYPWRVAGNRVLAADRARVKTSPDHTPISDNTVYMDTSASPDTTPRIEAETARVGVASFTTADRTLIGTYYDDFTVQMWLGWVGWSVSDYWLSYLIVQPQPTFTGTTKALTVDEWYTLWGDWPGPPWAFREVDVTACTVELVPSLSFASASGTAPASITRREVTSATSGSQFYPADTIEAEPAIGTVPGSGSSFTLTGATGPLSDLTTGPHFRVGSTDSPLPPSGVVSEFDLPTVLVPWGIAGGPQSAAYAQWLDYPPLWPTGVDPGYDETGGIPPTDPPSRIYRGGTGADRWAEVRLDMVWRFTVRVRWVAYTPGTPPLWQRQRIGVMDSPEQFTAGLVTPQSSPWQGGTL